MPPPMVGYAKKRATKTRGNRPKPPRASPRPEKRQDVEPRSENEHVLEVEDIIAARLAKLDAAEDLGATPIDGSGDVVAALKEASSGGVDVALELEIGRAHV